MFKNVGVATLSLLIGCAAGVAIKETVTPIAGAQVHGRQFQHRCQELKWDSVLGGNELLPEFGAEGWELATFVSAEKKGFTGPSTRIVACFKRQVGQ